MRENNRSSPESVTQSAVSTTAYASFVSPVFLAIVLVPAAVSALSAFVLARNIARLAAVAATGLFLAAAFVLVVYLRAPTAHAPHGCSDCGLYLGRWWEPGVVLVVAAFGLAGWFAGLGTGALARRLIGRSPSYPASGGNPRQRFWSAW